MIVSVNMEGHHVQLKLYGELRWVGLSQPGRNLGGRSPALPKVVQDCERERAVRACYLSHSKAHPGAWMLAQI